MTELAPGSAHVSGQSVALSRQLLVEAADAATQGIERLQWAQQTPWQSVAADSMRAELYAAIQVLRSVSEAIADADDSVDRLRAAISRVEYGA